MFVYGDEIGMGEDLSLDGRNAVRTPMQWSDSPNGGFSTARQEELVLPVIDQGRYGYSNVNVEVQRKDPNSQLNWMKELIAVRKRLPVIGWGKLQVLETGNPAVFAHHIQAPKVGFLALHNLAGETCHGELQLQGDAYHLVFGEESLDQATKTGRKFHLPPYGYSWYSQQD